jgi:hypothetical protein
LVHERFVLEAGSFSCPDGLMVPCLDPMDLSFSLTCPINFSIIITETNPGC